MFLFMRGGVPLYLICKRVIMAFFLVFSRRLVRGYWGGYGCLVACQPIRFLCLKFWLLAYQRPAFGKFFGWDLFRPLVGEELRTVSRREWIE